MWSSTNAVPRDDITFAFSDGVQTSPLFLAALVEHNVNAVQHVSMAEGY